MMISITCKICDKFSETSVSGSDLVEIMNIILALIIRRQWESLLILKSNLVSEF